MLYKLDENKEVEPLNLPNLPNFPIFNEFHHAKNEKKMNSNLIMADDAKIEAKFCKKGNF